MNNLGGLKHVAFVAGVCLSLALAGCSQPEKSETRVSDSQNGSAGAMQQEEKDNFLWLEDVESPKSLDWVKDRNATTLTRLESDPRFATFQEDALSILNAQDKLSYVGIRGEYVYNLWTDENAVRGLWRRMPYADYVAGKDQWELLLDIDKLGKEEGKSWVYKGVSCLAPDYNRCIMRLSDGGKDAMYLREFDLSTKTFIEDGFSLGEAKGSVTWVNKDELLIVSAFNENERTDSGYGRIIKRWKRGQAYADAVNVLEAKQDDVFLFPLRFGAENPTFILQIGKTFYESDYYLYDNGSATKLDLPNDIGIEALLHGQLIALLRSDGFGFKQGDLIALDLNDLSAPAKAVFTPSAKQSIRGISQYGKNKLVMLMLEDVKGQAKLLDYQQGKWQATPVALPEKGTAGLMTSDDTFERAMFIYEDFLTPESIYVQEGNQSPSVIKRSPKRFNADDLAFEQRFATSKDGTQVPYFIVHKKDIKLDGKNPTLLYGYGGFEISLTPNYSSLLGKLWLEKGGVYVLSNIRGGGEYGPAWHQAALKLNRQRAYDDFFAIAEDLIAKQYTSPEHLAIKGGSNGGLLMGAAFTQRPDLFNGVVCAVPLLDMLRYHTLLAGASWMAEYGNPEDPEMRAFIKTYSPYQNLHKDKTYPEVLFITSTKDDRVHPGHARKMAAKMMEMGHPILYFENMEGGHAASADNRQVAARLSMEYVYLWQKVGAQAEAESAK